MNDEQLHASLLWLTCGVATADEPAGLDAPLADSTAMTAAWVRHLPFADDPTD